MSRKQATEVENLTEDDTKGIGMKYCVLKQDYQELQRETRALKKRIQRAKMKRDNLLGVVRFLRRKFKMLNGLASQEYATQSIAYEGADTPLLDRSNEPTIMITSIEDVAAQPQGPEQEPSLSLDGCDALEISGRKLSVERDLQVFSGPQRSAGTTLVRSFAKKPLIEDSELVSALKSSKFKDCSNGIIPLKRSGKRKISWQDETPLKV